MTAGDAQRRVGAIVVVRDALGRVLLVRQASGPFAGSWLLPGGGVDGDESVVHAAVRELREETGLTLTDARLVAAYQTTSDPPGAFDLTLFLYVGPATGELAAERGSDARWFAPDEIPDPHPVLRRELLDAEARTDDESAIAAALDGAGIRIERLTPRPSSTIPLE